MFDAGLHDELLRRMQSDQEVRLSLPKDGPVPDDLMEKWRSVDDDNTTYLKQVVDEYGWPGHDLVGEEGAHAAWLLAQHADHDPDFQRRCLALLRDAVDRGQAAPGDLAYLVDRVRVNEERPQVYGTQYHAPDGVFQPRPIEDRERLDERRAGAGLGPHADYDSSMRQQYG
ncbi:DUF6624 domain-containing protein [Nonomuraea guangzhouensis]|uniref:DUF6624 domain-containing protein n=1 Tax=Nonomuraea guangzhouensis TaxID=1291555 RepID=A0ABW4GGW9_9ACTN|nr:DUF6624 domain-containing protein [Nonomuraea guangzhouensis]